MLRSPRHVPLAILTRGGAAESIHYGSVAVTDAEGNLLYSAGDPGAPMFTRSSLKPFQAMPVLASGADRAYDFGQEELALMCASHSGEDRHVAVVSGMLEDAAEPRGIVRKRRPGGVDGRGQPLHLRALL